MVTRRYRLVDVVADDGATGVRCVADDYVKNQNVKSNRQGGLNKTMGNWSTR